MKIATGLVDFPWHNLILKTHGMFSLNAYTSGNKHIKKSKKANYKIVWFED